MNEQRKLWLGLGAALLTSTSLQAAQAENFDPALASASPAMVLAAASGQGGEGESGEGGEGGEGEGGDASSLATDEAAYLAQLGLVRGHLWVGIQLYKHGHKEMADTHMKHPGDELYADLKPAMNARGHEGFAKQLSALSDAVTNRAPEAEIEKRHAELEQAIAQIEQLDQQSLKTILLSIEKMVRTSADEYAIGVVEGEISNTHEYQDSLGFVEVARQRLASLTEAQRSSGPDAIAEVQEQLTRIENLWPSLDPQGRLDGDASVLYGAAARIQLAAFEL